MRIYFAAAFQRGLAPKVPLCFAEVTKGVSDMLRVVDSSDVHDVNTFFSSESGIFKAVGPEGEDMVVICPPGEPWFVRKSNYKPEGNSLVESWHVTKLASWAVSRKKVLMHQ